MRPRSWTDEFGQSRHMAPGLHGPEGAGFHLRADAAHLANGKASGSLEVLPWG